MNFIDFEYSAPTYRGFDVGNHFNECAGFDCKWEDYPNDAQAEHFARAYLQAAGDEVVCDSTWNDYNSAHVTIDGDERWTVYRRSAPVCAGEPRVLVRVGGAAGQVECGGL